VKKIYTLGDMDSFTNDLQQQYKGFALELGTRIGFGNLMHLASDIWGSRSKPGEEGGEFTVGPCRALTVKCICSGKTEESTCDWCCGSEWVTKKVSKIQRKKR